MKKGLLIGGVIVLLTACSSTNVQPRSNVYFKIPLGDHAKVYASLYGGNGNSTLTLGDYKKQMNVRLNW